MQKTNNQANYCPSYDVRKNASMESTKEFEASRIVGNEILDKFCSICLRYIFHIPAARLLQHIEYLTSVANIPAPTYSFLQLQQ